MPYDAQAVTGWDDKIYQTGQKQACQEDMDFENKMSKMKGIPDQMLDDPKLITKLKERESGPLQTSNDKMTESTFDPGPSF
jgi:hypothetical protein